MSSLEPQQKKPRLEAPSSPSSSSPSSPSSSPSSFSSSSSSSPPPPPPRSAAAASSSSSVPEDSEDQVEGVISLQGKLLGFIGGDWSDEGRIQTQIKAILSLCDGEEAPRHPHLPFLHLEVSDESDTDLTNAFRLAAQFIAKHPGEVLVKSARGISRAPAIWIAYLISVEKIPLKEAFGILKKCHHPTKLNAGFFEQLMALEKEVLLVKENSMNLADYRKSSVKKWF